MTIMTITTTVMETGGIGAGLGSAGGVVGSMAMVGVDIGDGGLDGGWKGEGDDCGGCLALGLEG